MFSLTYKHKTSCLLVLNFMKITSSWARHLNIWQMCSFWNPNIDCMFFVTKPNFYTFTQLVVMQAVFFIAYKGSFVNWYREMMFTFYCLQQCGCFPTWVIFNLRWNGYGWSRIDTGSNSPFPLLSQGPLKCFLEALGKLQKKFYAKNERLNCPIRTFLVTARSAASSGARVLKTLRSWGLEIDEALFLAGAPKGPLLQKIRPHIFFDDQMFHIDGAKEMGTIAAHVPYGIGQKYNKGKLIEQPGKQQKWEISLFRCSGHPQLKVMFVTISHAFYIYII